MSLFSTTGHRGTATSQLSNGHILNSGGGLPHQFPIQFAFNLDNGQLSGTWTNPVTATADRVTLRIELAVSTGRRNDL
jgi:hypothetical protein